MSLTVFREGESHTLLLQRLIARYGDVALVGERLKALMKDAPTHLPKSYAQLSDALAARNPPVTMSRQTVYETFSGRRRVAIDELLAIADVYGALISDLLLPEDAARQAEVWMVLDRAVGRVRRIAAEWDAYEEDIAIVREQLVDTPDLRTAVDAYGATAENDFIEWLEDRARRVKLSAAAETSFVPSLEVNKPAATRAAEDALSSTQLEWDLRGGYAHKIPFPHPEAEREGAKEA